MAPVWPWLSALLAALPVALAGHGDPIAQKYIVEFADAATVRINTFPPRGSSWTNLLPLV